MGRPTKGHAEELKRLELASMALADILKATGFLAIRLRQIHRRAPQLSALVDPGQAELSRIVDQADAAQELLSELLTQKQAARRYNYRKESDENFNLRNTQ